MEDKVLRQLPTYHPTFRQQLHIHRPHLPPPDPAAPVPMQKKPVPPVRATPVRPKHRTDVIWFALFTLGFVVSVLLVFLLLYDYIEDVTRLGP